MRNLANKTTSFVLTTPNYIEKSTEIFESSLKTIEIPLKSISEQSFTPEIFTTQSTTKISTPSTIKNITTEKTKSFSTEKTTVSSQSSTQSNMLKPSIPTSSIIEKASISTQSSIIDKSLLSNKFSTPENLIPTNDNNLISSTETLSVKISESHMVNSTESFSTSTQSTKGLKTEIDELISTLKTTESLTTNKDLEMTKELIKSTSSEKESKNEITNSAQSTHFPGNLRNNFLILEILKRFSLAIDVLQLLEKNFKTFL